MANKYLEALEYFLLWINPSDNEFDYDTYLKHRNTLKELVDKETPMKEVQKDGDSFCPKCKALMMIMLPSYCWRCGQKLGSDTDE